MITLLEPQEWLDYELLDSGNGEKLERFGQFKLSRPDPRAIWEKEDNKQWTNIEGKFTNDKWKFFTKPPNTWTIGYKSLRFVLKPTDFKHVGVFPEQAVNWNWLANKTRPGLKILNLFGYTGASTLVCAQKGAAVTHVDSSKPAMMWAGENADTSKIERSRIRWIQEDATKFVTREIKRQVKYDAIIMDPPRFGRGASGEVWKIENDLPKLISDCKKILSNSPVFFLVNAYTADLSSLAIGNLLRSIFPDQNIEQGELGLRETGNRKFILPAGIWARWG